MDWGIPRDYYFEIKGGINPHYRNLRWVKEGIPRGEISQDILDSFGISGFCQVSRNNAAERMKTIVSGRSRDNTTKETGVPEDDQEDELLTLNSAQQTE